MRLPDYVTYDPNTDIWTIYGVHYAGVVFEVLAKSLEIERLVMYKDKKTNVVFIQPYTIAQPQQPQKHKQVAS